MNDDVDRPLGAAFEQLRRDVDESIDVETWLVEAERTGRGERGRRRQIVVAAAAVVVLVAGVVGAVMIESNERSADVVAADGSSTEVGHNAPASTAPGSPCDGGDDTEDSATIYLVPGSDDEDLQRTSVAIGTLRGVRSVEVVDAAATFEQFLVLFADQPDLLESIDAGELPTSVRVELDRPWTQADTDALRDAVGTVLRVETSQMYAAMLQGRCAAAQGENPDPGGLPDSEPTTTAVGDPSAHTSSVRGHLSGATIGTPAEVECFGDENPFCPTSEEGIEGLVALDSVTDGRFFVNAATEILVCGADGLLEPTPVPFEELLAMVDPNAPEQHHDVATRVWHSGFQADVMVDGRFGTARATRIVLGDPCVEEFTE